MRFKFLGFLTLFFFSQFLDCNAEVFKRSKYFIAIKKNENELENIFNDLSHYLPFDPPENHFYADPILFKHNGTNYMFFEDYDYKKGIISYVTIDENLQIGPMTKILELPKHCSFPAIFQDNGRIYMTPETAAENEIALFEALDFPNQWVKSRVLIKGGWFSDPVLFKHNDYYWLFTSLGVDDFRLFFSRDLFGNFTPHPVNQEKKRGRSAGKLFWWNGKLIRPTMCCESGYGRAVVLKEILQISPEVFEERIIHIIEPIWDKRTHKWASVGINGTHTFDISEDFVVYDGRYTEEISR